MNCDEIDSRSEDAEARNRRDNDPKHNDVDVRIHEIEWNRKGGDDVEEDSVEPKF